MKPIPEKKDWILLAIIHNPMVAGGMVEPMLTRGWQAKEVLQSDNLSEITDRLDVLENIRKLQPTHYTVVSNQDPRNKLGGTG